MKWTMEQTHIHQNITDLEAVLDCIAVEDFLFEIANEVKYLDTMLVEKFWEKDEDDEDIDSTELMTDEELFRFQQAQIDKQKLVQTIDK